MSKPIQGISYLYKCSKCGNRKTKTRWYMNKNIEKYKCCNCNYEWIRKLKDE